MTSRRRLRANRANALMSTGPRSAKGKRRVSRNACRHGLTTPPTEDVVSSWIDVILDDPSLDDVELSRDVIALVTSLAEAEARLDRARDAEFRFLEDYHALDRAAAQPTAKRTWALIFAKRPLKIDRQRLGKVCKRRSVFGFQKGFYRHARPQRDVRQFRKDLRVWLDYGLVIRNSSCFVALGIGRHTDHSARDFGCRSPIEGGEHQCNILAWIHLFDIDRIDASFDL